MWLWVLRLWQLVYKIFAIILGNAISDEGLDMLSRLFEEEVPEEELLNQLIPHVPSSVDEEVDFKLWTNI